MNITRQLENVSRRFVLMIIGLSVLSVGLLAATLYGFNVIRFDDSVSSEKLHSVVEGNEAVVGYLEEQKASEAHFITIASLIKQDQQSALGNALMFVIIPVVILAGGMGYLLARYLLRPVKESYESQERFLQDAAHELRNPLAAMSLTLENAGNTKGGKDAELQTTMRRQTKRLVRITEDLLYLERRQPGKEIKPVNISNLLEDILEDLQPAISHKKIKLSKSIDKKIEMEIDPADFIKMCRNILENAIKFSDAGKVIKVGLTRDKDIEFVVKDQGIGIPEDELENIGRRFYRAKNSSKVDGSGLGIAIVNKVLNTYGGDLKITSKPNKGTTVKISF